MGARSKGCRVCVRRKIKCDETLPECLQCQRSGRQCSGPVIGRIFLDGAPKRELVTSKTDSRARESQIRVSTDSKHTRRYESTNSGMSPTSAPRRRHSSSTQSSIRPISITSEAALDPFHSLPVRMNRSSEVLLEIYLFHFSRKISTMGPSSYWLPMALADPVLLETTLFVAASFYRALSRSENNNLALYHKAALVRLINNRLSDGEASVADSMICAVSLLAGSEGINGSFEDYKIHIDGLQRIIRQRGGLHYLAPNSSALKMALSAYSYGACRFRIGSDAFVNYAVKSFPSLEGQSPPPSPLCCHTPTSHSSTLKQRNEALLNCLDALQTMTTSIEGSHYKQFTNASLYSFDTQLTALEFQLCSLEVLHSKPNLHFRIWTPQQETTILTAFLFTSIFLRERPLAAAVHRDIFNRADGHLKGSTANGAEAWAEEEGKLLWILMILGTVAVFKGDENAEWYVSEIRAVLKRLSLQCLGWSAVEHCLGRTAWSKGLWRFVDRLWGMVSDGKDP